MLKVVSSLPLLLMPLAAACDAAAQAVAENAWMAEEARQAVAVDREHFYAITDAAIGKYSRQTGRRVAQWRASEHEPLVHLNSGVVREGRLYTAHSNYPAAPPTSSVEVFDTSDLRHAESHSFGVSDGWLTVVDRHEGAWWAVFAHYSKRVPDGPHAKPSEYTELVRYDNRWRRTGGWVFPAEVIERLEPNSVSGAAWGPEGSLWATGHDRGEVYQIALPQSGSRLTLLKTRPAPIAGQGIAWDPADPGVLWGIRRPTREVVRFRLP